jgi:putative transposase
MNRKHQRVGHLFQGSYLKEMQAILVDKDAYLLELCRYIVLNPVSAIMVDTPDEWLWSSWDCMIGKNESTSWLATVALLNLFAKKRSEAIAQYIYFVEQGINKAIWEDLHHQVFLGDEACVEKNQLMQKLLAGDVSEIPFK